MTASGGHDIQQEPAHSLNVTNLYRYTALTQPSGQISGQETVGYLPFTYREGIDGHMLQILSHVRNQNSFVIPAVPSEL